MELNTKDISQKNVTNIDLDALKPRNVIENIWVNAVNECNAFIGRLSFTLSIGYVL